MMNLNQFVAAAPRYSFFVAEDDAGSVAFLSIEALRDFLSAHIDCKALSIETIVMHSEDWLAVAPGDYIYRVLWNDVDDDEQVQWCTSRDKALQFISRMRPIRFSVEPVTSC
jgi:hypothetical protein